MLPDPPELPEPEDVVPLPGVPLEEPPSVDADPQPRMAIGAATSIAAATQLCRFIESNLPAAAAPRDDACDRGAAASLSPGIGQPREN